MMNLFCRIFERNKSQAGPACLFVLAALVTVPAGAADANSPLNAAAAVPPVTYESPLVDFRAFDPDEEMIPWKQANDRVGALGGWRSYLKNAAKKQSPESSHSRGADKSGMERNKKSN